jgi:hypothetical protein
MTLVPGRTGKTGRQVVQRLTGRDLPGADRLTLGRGCRTVGAGGRVRRAAAGAAIGPRRGGDAGGRSDLAAWIFNPSDSEYQAAARGHDVQ